MNRKSISQEAAEYERDRDRFATRAREKERIAAQSAITVAILSRAVGMDEANRFLSEKVQSLRPGEARFFGPAGIEAVRHKTASGLDAGYSFDPEHGCSFALKAKISGDEAVVIPLSPAAMVSIVDAATQALACLWDQKNMLSTHAGYKAAEAYSDLLEVLAQDRLAIDGTRAEIYAAARRQAEAEKAGAILGMEREAEARAARRVESAVRKLATAASMGPGLERSMLIEEAQPLIRKAFGADRDDD